MQYLFQIASTTISICIPNKLKLEDAYEPFLVKDRKPDLVIQFQDWTKNIYFEEGRKVYQGNTEVYQTSFGFAIIEKNVTTGEPYLYVPLKEDESIQICYVKESEWYRFQNIHQIFQIIEWERILNRRDVFLLHASFLIWNQRGIVFTAPSGTGKSTQADLWENYEGAEIINGDRVAISQKEGEWKGYGLPVAGSSHIYKNKSCFLNAVVVLRQGKHNLLKRLEPVEAFRWIYSETTVQFWDREFQNRLMELLSKFVVEVPIYMLECLPDKSAVDILKKELVGGNYYDGYGTGIGETIAPKS